MTTPRESPEASEGQLQRSARLAMLFLGMRSLLQVIIRIPAMIYLARVLTPLDFGIFAMLQFAMSFLKAIGDGGLGAALLQREDEPSQLQLSSVFWTQMLIALTAVLVLGLIAPLFVASFSLAETATMLLRVFSLSFLFTLARSVPMLLLERRMRFGWVGAVEFFGSMSQYSIACIGATLGFGTAALVSGVLAETFVMFVIAFLVTRWRPSFCFDSKTVKPILVFGLNFQGFHILNLINQAVSPVLLGLGPGAAALGLVNFGRTTAESPAELLNLVRRVAFPYFSRIQDKPALFVVEFNRAISLAALPTYLFMTLFFVAGAEIIQVLYDPKWMPALGVLWIFSAVLGMTFFSWIGSAAMDAMGDAASVLRITLFTVGINWLATGLATFFWPTPEAFALGFSVQAPITSWMMYSHIRKRGYPIAPLFSTLPAIAAAVIVVGLSLGLDLKTRIHGAITGLAEASLNFGWLQSHAQGASLLAVILILVLSFLALDLLLDRNVRDKLKAWLQARRQRGASAAG